MPTAAEVVDEGGPDAVAELECLYWVGCAASFDDRNRKVARAFVTCLEAAGVDVRGARPGGVVHAATRRAGWATSTSTRCSRRATSRRSTATSPKTIVTACPHCFNTLGNEYGQFGGRYEVVHHSTYLARLVAEGRLTADRRRRRRGAGHA